MRKNLPAGMLENLKNSLRDLENVRMTSPDDPVLRDLKNELRKMIQQAEDAALE